MLPFGLGPLEMLLMAVPMLIWAWGLLQCINRESDQGNTKIAWLLVILLVPVAGSLLYVLVRRPQRVRQLGA